MQPPFGRALAVLMVAAAVAACGQAPAVVQPKVEAVTVEAIPGSDLERLTLSEHAAKRLGVQTTPVAAGPAGQASRTSVPYSAIVYDAAGATWMYTSPNPLVFVRHEVVVDRVTADQAFLSAGPAIGTPVVTVGAAELWGIETGVGGGH
jgi:hypothetical protein